ncbi:hypothetical protein PCANC_14365 [Puccinia coronata f. sp. avenae]|uniref:Uncharacterized protein n=1 Tax=Puccinia coronata f. sp. avenae TaxID=200324 RepID=A0A2N5V9H0_9BASI|nr:hypothetical protein PCANC_14365 [Puccinia coronata f. sp. avenae]
MERYVRDSQSAALIAREDILTLKDAQAGKTSVGKQFIHVQDGHIGYIHAYLAKLGIRCWGPDLDEGPESLFNSACRIAALISFQKIGIGGGYNFLNIDQKYKEDMVLFINTYKHYVHHVLAQKYHAKQRRSGSIQDSVTARNAARNRSRLADARLQYAKEHKFPKRYIKVLGNVGAHREDEWDAEGQCFAIKTLPYRSNAANIFFRRLDLAIKAGKVTVQKST